MACRIQRSYERVKTVASFMDYIDYIKATGDYVAQFHGKVSSDVDYTAIWKITTNIYSLHHKIRNLPNIYRIEPSKSGLSKLILFYTNMKNAPSHNA